MTQSLPTPGQDNGTWGTMLNNFLTVSLNADGTVASSVIADAQISSSAAINPTKISGTAEVQTNKGAASGYAPLNSSSLVPTTYLGTNTATSSNYLRGDGTWNSPPTASNATTSAPGLVQLAGDLGGVGTTASAPTLLGTTNVENIISANTTVAGALQATGNLATIGDSGSARANLHVPAITPVAAVSLTNVASLTTTTTSIDNYSLAQNDLVLLVNQTTGTQNGIWQIPSSGPWVRPTEFPTNTTVKGRFAMVINGADFANTVWLLAAPTTGVLIDTNTQVWNQQGPRGSLGSAAITASSSSFSTTFSLVTGLSLTVVPGFRPLRVSFSGLVTSNSVSGLLGVGIEDSTNTITLIRRNYAVATSSYPRVISDMSTYYSPTAGTPVTIQVWALAPSGTTASIVAGPSPSNAILMIEEI